MNWHAHQLRSELKKLTQDYQARLSLLTATSIDAQNYLELEKERDKLQEQLTKTKQELKAMDEISSDLASENEQKEEKIKDLTTKLTEKETELSTTKTTAQQELVIHERNWTKKYRTSQEANQLLLTNKKDNEKLLREAKKTNNELAKERNNYQTQLTALTTSLNSLLTKEHVNSLSELQTKITSQAKILDRLVKDNGDKQQWIETHRVKLLNAKPTFLTIKDLIEQSKTIDLFNKNQKQLLTELTNFEQALNWTTVYPSGGTWMGSSIFDTIKQTITGKKKAQPKLPAAQETQWRNIDQDFTTDLINEWELNGFNYLQTKEWIDIGLGVKDAHYCAWLRDIKQVDAEWVLNYGDPDQLNKEYENWQNNQP